MKKVTSLLTVALSIALLVSACSSNQTNNGNNSAAPAQTTDGGDLAPATISFLSWNSEEQMKPVLDGFKAKHPQIKIDFQHAPPVQEYNSKLQTMLLTNSATDVFIVSSEMRRQIMNEGYAMDLKDQPFAKVLTPPAVKINTDLDGNLIAFSQSSWIAGVYYNKALFEQAGITELPNSWAGFVNAALTFKEAGITPFYMNLQDMPGALTALVGLETIKQDPDYDKKVFAGEKTFADGWIKPLEKLNELVEKGIVTKDTLGLQEDQMAAEFIAGNVAMFASGSWQAANIEKGNPELDYEMMPYYGDEPGSYYYAGNINTGFAINAKTKNKEAALAFLNYLATPEGLQKFEEGTATIVTAEGYTPNLHPSLASAYDNGLIAGNIYLPMAYWQRHSEALRAQTVASVQNMIFGKETPEQVAAEMDAKLAELDKQ
jgi:raffinose/stachyose/melibiose transport system substrate-binding protein